MRQISFCLLAFSCLLAACSAPSAEQLVASAQVIAATGVRLTLQAMPTETLTPSATTTMTLLLSTTPSAMIASNTPTGETTIASGTLVNGLPTELSATEKADKSDNSTVVLLQNNTDQIIWLIIDGPIYLEYRFSDSFTILLPLGEYHYRVWIGSKGPMEGTFRIGNHDKHTMIFSPGKVQFQGP